MKALIPSNNHIWILIGIGLAIRLLAYFGTGYGEMNALRPIIMASDLAIGFLVFILARKANESRQPLALSKEALAMNADSIEAGDSPDNAENNTEMHISQADDNTKGGLLPDAAQQAASPHDYWSLTIAALWILNPAAFFVSSGWGFIEPLFVLLLLLLFVAIKQKLFSAVLVVILPAGFQLRHFFGENVFARSATINAYNFYTMAARGSGGSVAFGFMGISFSTWGTVFTIAIIIGAAIAVYVDFANGGKNYYLIIGAYFILLFLFATGMQHRALFPGLVFLLMHFIERRNARVLWLYFAFSFTLLLNVFQSMGLGRHMMGISGFNVLLGISLGWLVYKEVRPSQVKDAITK